MRNFLRVVGYGFLSILSAELLVWAVDWYARVDLVTTMLEGHPHAAQFVKSPIFMGLMLVLGFVFLWVERRAKLPLIVAKIVNCKLVPKLGTVMVQALFDAQAQRPGWDQHFSDWDWFIEISLANESATPTTLERVDVRLSKIRKLFGVRLPSWIGSKTFPCTHALDFSRHHIHTPTLDIYNDADAEIPSLIKGIKGVPLTMGIGHRGWLRFESRHITQSDLRSSQIEIWLVDAYGQRHYVSSKRGDEVNWDNSFSILETGH